MKSLMKFAAFALIGTATLTAPAFAALKEGTQAPDFTAPAYLAGKPFTFSLANALKQGPVVVYFLPRRAYVGLQYRSASVFASH